MSAPLSPLAEHVLFVINGAHVHSARSVHAHRTWCTRARCLFLTDAAFKVDPGMDVRVVPGPPCPHDKPANMTRRYEQTKRYQRAQDRFLLGLAMAKRQGASHGSLLGTRWVVLVDDDSFVFPQSLLALLQRERGALNHTEPLYLGDFTSPVADLGDGDFACGGGGLG